MKVLIRADASIDIGSGHVMRCLTLAQALRKKNAEVTFICRSCAGHCGEIIVGKGFPVHMLPDNFLFDTFLDADFTTNAIANEKPDWLIVDHYSIDISWEKRLRPYVGRIMVIDDLADRSHDCDLLLDQNLYENLESRYNGLVPSTCRLFLGPRHALLRDEFIEKARMGIQERFGSVRRILAFFGGSDPDNETGKALEAIRILDRPDIFMDVIIGASNPNSEKIREACLRMPKVSFHYNVNNMAELMFNADLIIGAGGTTTWERCSLGLPSITLILADNQCQTTCAVAAAGATRNMGTSEGVTSLMLATEIGSLIEDVHRLQEMSRCAGQLMQIGYPKNGVNLFDAIMEINDART